jgi:hypothetical protein
MSHSNVPYSYLLFATSKTKTLSLSPQYLPFIAAPLYRWFARVIRSDNEHTGNTF